MTIDLFGGLPVSDYEHAIAWYGRLLGNEPAFCPNAAEAVWELAEHRYLYIKVSPEHAGHALHTVYVSNLDDRVQSIRARGIDPAVQETYGNGVRKVTYRDPDGNEIGFGGGPPERPSDRPPERPPARATTPGPVSCRVQTLRISLPWAARSSNTRCASAARSSG